MRRPIEFPKGINILTAGMFAALTLGVLFIVQKSLLWQRAEITFLFAFLISFVLNFVVQKKAILAIPVERSSHSVPTPLCGGVGIFISITVLSIAYLYFSFDFSQLYEVSQITLLNKCVILLCLSLCMGVMGFLDDTYHLRWFTRIFLQFIFAAVFLFRDSVPFLEQLHIPFWGSVTLGNFQWVLALIWMVGFSNLYNFMDGLNGLVTGYTMIALLGIIGSQGVDNALGLGILTIVGATLGFFIHNFPKAKLFLGDTGSQFLGFLIAGLAIILPHATHERLPLLAMPLLFWPFINEGLWTFGRRIYFKRLVYDSHRDYLFHLLNQMGHSHTRIAILYFCFALFQVGWLYILRQTEYTYHLILFCPNVILYGLWGYAVVLRARQRGIAI